MNQRVITGGMTTIPCFLARQQSNAFWDLRKEDSLPGGEAAEGLNLKRMLSARAATRPRLENGFQATSIH